MTMRPTPTAVCTFGFAARRPARPSTGYIIGDRSVPLEADDFWHRRESKELVGKRDAITFAITGPITPTDLPGLCERVCTLLELTGAPVAYCDVRGISPDAVTVDALARLQLAAHRRGCQVRLRQASSELRELVAFMGLADVLPD